MVTEQVAPRRAAQGDVTIAEALRTIDFAPLERVAALGTLRTPRDRMLVVLVNAFLLPTLLELGNSDGDVPLERLRRFVQTGRGLDA